MNREINELQRTLKQHGFATESNARKSAIPDWFKSRLVGPGALYNFGNIIALSAGPMRQLLESQGQITIREAVYQNWLGSPEAVWLTSAMILFIVAGEIYHRADQAQHHAPTRLIQLADLTAGLAALLLTVALLLVGDATLALIAGLLLAGGKLGNALLPAFSLANEAKIENGLRIAAVISRAPSIGTLTWAAIVGAQTGVSISLPVTMIFCFLLWLWADLLLMRSR